MRKLDEEAKNAITLADMLLDPSTTPALQIRILNKLIEGRKNPNFFTSIFDSKMSFGECPKCGHGNHWLVPETVQNEMGHVSAEIDPRVKRETTIKDCKTYSEACMKRKINI